MSESANEMDSEAPTSGVTAPYQRFLQAYYPGAVWSRTESDEGRALFLTEGPYAMTTALLIAPLQDGIPAGRGCEVHIATSEAIRLALDILGRYAPERLA